MKFFTALSQAQTFQNVYQVVSPESENLCEFSDGSRFYLCKIQRIAEEITSKPGHSNSITEEPFLAVIELSEGRFYIDFTDSNPVLVKAAFYNRVLPSDQVQTSEDSDSFVRRVEARA
jgi:hypothetical protein